jgi:hypothetical protein
MRAGPALLLLLACAGCAQYGTTDTQYITTEHAFTEAAAARALSDADRVCRTRKMVAVKTGGACTLARCTSHYYCMSPADAEKYKP